MIESGDYISREAALDVVNGWRDQLIPTYGKNDEYVKCLETVAEHLESLPAADVRPVRMGKWVDMGDFISCSSCNATHLKEFESYYGKVMRLDVRTNYCPNCGADMREES